MTSNWPKKSSTVTVDRPRTGLLAIGLNNSKLIVYLRFMLSFRSQVNVGGRLVMCLNHRKCHGSEILTRRQSTDYTIGKISTIIGSRPPLGSVYGRQSTVHGQRLMVFSYLRFPVKLAIRIIVALNLTNIIFLIKSAR